MAKEMYAYKKMEKDKFYVLIDEGVASPSDGSGEQEKKDEKNEAIVVEIEKCACGKDQGQKNAKQGGLSKKKLVLVHTTNPDESYRSTAEKLEMAQFASLFVLTGLIILVLSLIWLTMVEMQNDGCE